MTTLEPSSGLSSFPSFIPTSGPTQPFAYLGGGVAIAFCVYGFISAVSLFIYLKYYQDEVYEFKSSYESTIKHPYMIIALGCYRFMCFIFFLVFAGIYVWVIIYPGSQGTKNYQYYTYWNVGLICFYYLIATICSVLGYFYKPENDSNGWSPLVVYFGKFQRIIFSVAGSSALFITVINFSLLSSKGSFANISDHLMTSITLLIEMFLNTTTVPAYNLFYMITWAIIWISFTLIIYPGAGILNGWPYFFLRAYSPALYFWYPLLLFVMVIFYLIWDGLSYLKVKYIIKSSSTAASNKAVDEVRGVINDGDHTIESL